MDPVLASVDRQMELSGFVSRGVRVVKNILEFLVFQDLA
jgi:hypothetical protein